MTERKINTLSVTQFAGHYGISTNVVEQWIRVGALKANSVDGEWRIPDTPEIKPKKKFENVILWLGTTAEELNDIVEEGHAETVGGRFRGVWMTTSLKYARRVAIENAQYHREVPIVISFEVDLEEYTAFSRISPSVYLFYTPISNESIRCVSALTTEAAGLFVKKRGNDENIPESVNVPINRKTGKQGMLDWVNCYLRMEGENPIGVKHPAAVEIWKWVESEYASGRSEAISDGEMLTLLMTYLKLGVKTDLLSRFMMESQQTFSVLHTPVSNALAWKVESMSREQRDKNIIRLWHGTTEHRAKRIIEEGFKMEGTRRNVKIWLTTYQGSALGMARHRAEQRNETPVLLDCEIDIKKYSAFETVGAHYVFRTPIAGECVRNVFRCQAGAILIPYTSGPLAVEQTIP
ncbi:hypothetical protein IH992_15075 [Candidatus Poribacteria bacterium]|nr:hypothetical protein [Candidatus Poribacteria bacterium]